MTSDVHAVYLVGLGRETELRYSLRSLHEFYPDSSVTVIGRVPRWLRDARAIESSQLGVKGWNIFNAVAAACACNELPDSLVLMNTDFLCVGRCRLEARHRGPLRRHADSLRNKKSAWWRALHATAGFLESDRLPSLSFELHEPFPFSRHRMGKTVEQVLAFSGDSEAPLLVRSVYANTWLDDGAPGAAERIAWEPGDLARAEDEGAHWLSYPAQQLGGALGRVVATRFPTPSRWETAA